VPDRTECACHTFDGANRDSHTVSLGRALVHASLWNPKPVDFSASVRPHPKPSPFSGPTTARVSATTACFELVRPAYGLPCDSPWSTNWMRTTDFCFPLPDLRVPAPRELPASLRGLRLAHGPRACTRDQETGGPGVSRCLIRFGGLRRVDARRFLPSALDRAVPLTPPSLPVLSN